MASEQHQNAGLLWGIKWFLFLMLGTLIVDFFYVLWPYPHGGGDLEGFRAAVRIEWIQLCDLGGDRYAKVAYALYDGFRTVLFRWPGIDYMIVRARDATPLDSGSELMRRGVLGMETFWGVAETGLKLFCARLAVIVICLPLILLVMLGGLVDGLVNWYRRRTGGGRESGFIYHRAKRHTAHALQLLGIVYILPPVNVDPVWSLSAYAVLSGIGLHIAAANFKKYI